MNHLIEKEIDIPVIDRHNHASNLIELNNGDLLCTWFSGSNEGQSDIKIVVSRFDNRKKLWSEPKHITYDNTRSEQNPTLFHNPDGTIWLVYTSQEGIHQNSSVVRYLVSNDDGNSWTDSEILFDKKGSFVRNPPVILNDKTIMLPAYYSIKSETGLFGDDYSVVKVSHDFGHSWEERKIEGSNGLVHLNLIKIDENKLIGFFRSRKADNIYKTESHDAGKTWTFPVPIELLNNNSSIQAKKLITGEILIAYNNINASLKPPEKNMPPWFREEDLFKAGVDIEQDTEIIWGTVRNPLTIATSNDNGATWNIVGNIQESVEDNKKDEYSYPSILETYSGDIHITYTYQRKYIKHKILKKGLLK